MQVMNPKVFHKFGVTSDYDVLKRFNRPDFDGYDVKILFSHYLPVPKAYQQEQNFLDRYKKNVRLDETFHGITEIRAFDEATKKAILKELYGLKAKWFAENQKFKKYPRIKFYFVEFVKK